MTITQNELIDASIEALKAAQNGGAYVPVPVSEQCATILQEPGHRFPNWSQVAKALFDQGQALALYTQLFPEDRWMLGKGRTHPAEPEFGFFVYGPFVKGDNDVSEPIVTAEHDICAIAIMMAALARKRTA